MSNGRIVEQGDHNSLLGEPEGKGLYKQMWKTQEKSTDDKSRAREGKVGEEVDGINLVNL